MKTLKPSTKIYQGEDIVLNFEIRDDTGQVVDISGATAVQWAIFPKSGGAAIFSKTLGSGVTANTNDFDVAIDEADTDDVTPGSYVQEMRMTLATKQTVIVQGSFDVIKSYTVTV